MDRYRTRVQDLLHFLLEIEKHGDLKQYELAARLKCSAATITRLFLTARKDYQVVITRRAGRHGVYTIEDWGILNRDRIKTVTTRKGGSSNSS